MHVLESRIEQVGDARLPLAPCPWDFASTARPARVQANVRHDRSVGENEDAIRRIDAVRRERGE